MLIASKNLGTTRLMGNVSTNITASGFRIHLGQSRRSRYLNRLTGLENSVREDHGCELHVRWYTEYEGGALNEPHIKIAKNVVWLRAADSQLVFAKIDAFITLECAL